MAEIMVVLSIIVTVIQIFILVALETIVAVLLTILTILLTMLVLVVKLAVEGVVYVTRVVSVRYRGIPGDPEDQTPPPFDQGSRYIPPTPGRSDQDMRYPRRE